jgi:hypothetical protein
MKNKNKITFEELKAELDQWRTQNRKLLTEEQIEFLKLCREKDTKITFDNMVKLWEKAGWGIISPTTIRNYYNGVRDGKIKKE